MPYGIFFLNDKDRYGFPVKKNFTNIKHLEKSLKTFGTQAIVMLCGTGTTGSQKRDQRQNEQNFG